MNKIIEQEEIVIEENGDEEERELQRQMQEAERELEALGIKRGEVMEELKVQTSKEGRLRRQLNAMLQIDLEL